MIGLLVIGSFAGMCLVRAGANVVMRRDEAGAARRVVERSAGQLIDEAQEWLDRRHPGAV